MEDSKTEEEEEENMINEHIKNSELRHAYEY